MSTSTLQERVERLLHVSGLDAKNLSVLCGLGSSHVGQIVRGDVTAPGVDTLSAIASVTGVSQSWLVFGEGREPSDRTIRTAVSAAKAVHPHFRKVA